MAVGGIGGVDGVVAKAVMLGDDLTTGGGAVEDGSEDGYV